MAVNEQPIPEPDDRRSPRRRFAMAVAGVLLPNFWDADTEGGPFPVNGQEFWALSMGAASLLYVVGSLLDKPPVHDIDKVLRLGEFAIEGEKIIEDAGLAKGWGIFGVTPEFSRRVLESVPRVGYTPRDGVV